MREQGPKAIRYTIDNCYGDALVTVLRTELAHGITKFTDSPEDWDKETLLTEHPDDLVNRMSVPAGGPVITDLKPGRVFLRGQITKLKRGKALIGFSIDEDAPETCFRIDDLPIVKEKIKRLYSDLLVARGRSD